MNRSYFALGYKMNVDKFDLLLFSGFTLEENQLLEACEQLNNAELLRSCKKEE